MYVGGNREHHLGQFVAWNDKLDEWWTMVDLLDLKLVSNEFRNSRFSNPNNWNPPTFPPQRPCTYLPMLPCQTKPTAHGLGANGGAPPTNLPTLDTYLWPNQGFLINIFYSPSVTVDDQLYMSA